MLPRAFLQLWWAKAIIAIFFILSGTVVTLLVSYAGPSFWYFPCGVLWALSGFLWFIRPTFAPGISVFPVLGIASMLVPALPRYKQLDSIYWLLTLCVVIALTLITAAFQQREARNVMAIAISFSLVLSAFAVGRLFTDKVEVRTYSMNWSANGIAPWGRVQENEKDEIPVVIYRNVAQWYCFDAIFSPDLKAQLTSKNKQVITVDYNLFKDFGRVRGYNVRDVDGMVFNEGDHPVRSTDSPGYGGRSGSGECFP